MSTFLLSLKKIVGYNKTIKTNNACALIINTKGLNKPTFYINVQEETLTIPKRHVLFEIVGNCANDLVVCPLKLD